jgi:hypothetical protein
VEVGLEIARHGLTQNIEVHTASSLEGNAMWANRPDKRIGAIFLDGADTYTDYLADILLWIPYLNKGGVLMIHDYGQAQNKQAIDLAIRDNPDFVDHQIIEGMYAAVKK